MMVLALITVGIWLAGMIVIGIVTAYEPMIHEDPDPEPSALPLHPNHKEPK